MWHIACGYNRLNGKECYVCMCVKNPLQLNTIIVKVSGNVTVCNYLQCNKEEIMEFHFVWSHSAALVIKDHKSLQLIYLYKITIIFCVAKSNVYLGKVDREKFWPNKLNFAS